MFKNLLIKIFLFTLLFSFLNGGVTSKNIVQEYNKLTKVKDIDFDNISLAEVYSYYSKYQNMYLVAKETNNIKIEIKSLEGIITIGNKLSDDVDSYKAKLRKLYPNSPVLNKNIEDNNTTYLNDIKLYRDYILLNFSNVVGKNSVSYFKLFDKRNGLYRYVFDVSAKLNVKLLRKRLENKMVGVKDVRIAQFNDEIVRIVIDSRNILYFSNGFKNNNYYLYVKVEARKYKNRIISYNYKNNKLIFKFKNKINRDDIDFSKFIDQRNNLNTYVFSVKSYIRKGGVIKFPAVSRVVIDKINNDYFKLDIQDKKRLRINYKIDENMLIFTILNPANSYVNRNSSIPPVVNNSNFIVVVDAGHGGKDPGTMDGRTKEKDIALNIALKLRNKLKSRGYKVYMTRDKDYFVELKDRTTFANNKNADLFISIHVNSLSTNSADRDKKEGFETFFLSPARSTRAKNVAAYENSMSVNDIDVFSKNIFLSLINKEKIKASQKLAIDIQQSIYRDVKKIDKNVKSLGVKKGPFWVLVAAQMPSVLIETGFLPREKGRLTSRRYQSKVASGIADGVDSYFRKNVSMR